MTFADEKGFRFSLQGVDTGTAVTLPAVGMSDEQSAPPGKAFVYADLVVTNLQADRPAPLDDLANWYFVIPKTADEDTRLMCGQPTSGQCMEGVGCYRLNVPDEQAEITGMHEETLQMPPSARWELRCVLDEHRFYMISYADPMPTAIAGKARFFRIVDATRSKKELIFP